MLDSDILQAILPLDKINVVLTLKHHQSLLKRLKCRSKLKIDLLPTQQIYSDSFYDLILIYKRIMDFLSDHSFILNIKMLTIFFSRLFVSILFYH